MEPNSLKTKNRLLYAATDREFTIQYYSKKQGGAQYFYFSIKVKLRKGSESNLLTSLDYYSIFDVTWDGIICFGQIVNHYIHCEEEIANLAEEAYRLGKDFPSDFLYTEAKLKLVHAKIHEGYFNGLERREDTYRILRIPISPLYRRDNIGKRAARFSSDKIIRSRFSNRDAPIVRLWSTFTIEFLEGFGHGGH